jgi:DNA-binding SARP family transcriptional activator
MLVKILQTVAVDCGHRRADLGGPKQRAVLGLLALRVNQAVSVDELINDLWTEDMPGRPRKTVQVYIANLRRVLDRPDRIESGPFGYRLVLSDDELDLGRFRRTVSAARAAAGSAPDRAARLYQEALALWPGQALADLQNHPAVARLGRPLAELRREVVEEQIAHTLRQGRAAAAIAPLEELIRANEWRERPWTLLMEAHYRCGRQTEALETYQRVRRLLRDELGVEPGPQLREMERRILRHDPALGTPPAPAAAPAPAVVADERRTATFVSFAVADYHERARSLDPEDLAALVDEFHALVGRIIGVHRGVVDHLADDRVLAHVGHPRAAEDDPHRAVRAALAVVRQSPVAVRAGVHTGLALFRTGRRSGVTGTGPRWSAPRPARGCACRPRPPR